MLVEILVVLAIPLGLDLYLPVPEDNPLTAEKIEFGRQLFFDRGSHAMARCRAPRVTSRAGRLRTAAGSRWAWMAGRAVATPRR